ncbi:MAG: hypothetical protein M0R70_07995 [Nitrospirae bacterium]|nr:hypothetical protein [Nitrospirota bacterium]
MQTRLILVFVIAIVLSATSNSFAAIYKYIDQNGIICFADDLQSVPEPCRATAKIVNMDQEQARNPAIQKQPQVQAEAIPENAESSSDRGTVSIEGYTKSFFSGRVLISVVVVVSALFVFVILGIIDADHKKAIKIVRAVVLWGMSVYLIVAHGEDVVNMFKTLKGEVNAVQHESGEKGKKAAKALKELNALTQDGDDAASQNSGGVDPEKRD